VGFLFQDTDQQLFERTVLREVSYGPAAAGRHRADAAERARAALAAVGLEQLAGEHPYELGFAQRRFVALASLIASGPALWVLDEPTAGLDQRGRGRMARLILDHAAAGGAVVLATHDESFARAVCTRSWNFGTERSGTARTGPQAPAGRVAAWTGRTAQTHSTAGTGGGAPWLPREPSWRSTNTAGIPVRGCRRWCWCMGTRMTTVCTCR
jgi:energy-coupling factor transporter ATP-binding protein EcfA2